MSFRRGPDLAIFHRFVRPPYGGSNQFLLALRGELERRGVRVGANRIGRATRAAVLNAFAFDVPRLRRGLREGCRVVHRVDGPVKLYRGFDDGSDDAVVAINEEFADATVFQSRYSADAHRELGAELRAPVIVPNAVDPAVFHAGSPRQPGSRVKLVATSWSPNRNKGAATLEWMDANLDFDRYDVTFVGQTEARLERVRVVPPVDSASLAEILRSHDVYLAASRNDPASNALLEGLACGLPALYARSGGHAELVGDGGVGFDADEEIPERLERLVAEYDDRRAAIRIPAIADVADRYLQVAGLA